MKITNNQIRKIIKEELNKILKEDISPEKMLKLADMFISNDEESFKHALMLLETLEIFQHVTFEDRTTEYEDSMKHHEKYRDNKREDYRWLMLATPEFYEAAAEVLEEIGRFGPMVVFDKVYTDEKYRWTYTFYRGRNPGDMAQISVKKQIRPDF